MNNTIKWKTLDLTEIEKRDSNIDIEAKVHIRRDGWSFYFSMHCQN
jgi:hypothetical protein